MTIILLLTLLSVLGLGYVIGRTHEGCRKGGTLELHDRLAALDQTNVRKSSSEVFKAYQEKK